MGHRPDKATQGSAAGIGEQYTQLKELGLLSPNYPRWPLLWFLFSGRGRIGRSRFWLFHLAILAIVGLFMLATGLFYRTLYFGDVALGPTTIYLIHVVLSYSLYGFLLVAAVSSFAVAAKRFHDRDKSGWWSLIGLVPVLGIVWIVVECGCLKGTSGPNRFGPNPLGVHMDDLGRVFD